MLFVKHDGVAYKLIVLEAINDNFVRIRNDPSEAHELNDNDLAAISQEVKFLDPLVAS